MRYAEAYRLERLGSHPNIIKYFGAWEEKEHVFIQLELYDTSLDKYAKANHKICEEQLWDILIDLLLVCTHFFFFIHTSCNEFLGFKAFTRSEIRSFRHKAR